MSLIFQFHSFIFELQLIIFFTNLFFEWKMYFLIFIPFKLKIHIFFMEKIIVSQLSPIQAILGTLFMTAASLFLYFVIIIKEV